MKSSRDNMEGITEKEVEFGSDLLKPVIILKWKKNLTLPLSIQYHIFSHKMSEELFNVCLHDLWYFNNTWHLKR